MMFARRAVVLAICTLCASCAAPPAPPSRAAAPVPSATAQLPLGRPIAASPSAAVVLRNPGFELPFPAGGRCPTGWDCAAHSGAASFRFFHDETHPGQGKASGCIEPVTHEPWAKMVQGHARIEALRGKRVRLSGLVRLQDVAGPGAGLIAIAQGGSGNEVASRKDLQAGSSDWHRVQVDLDVPQSAFLLELGLVLEGTGRACLDDMRFEVLPGRPAV